MTTLECCSLVHLRIYLFRGILLWWEGSIWEGLRPTTAGVIILLVPQFVFVVFPAQVVIKLLGILLNLFDWVANGFLRLNCADCGGPCGF